MSLPTLGPGDSARMMRMLCPPVMGKRARRNTKTPMPPNQWVKLRQKRRDRGMASTSARMDAPVVVKPEMTSKRASTNRGTHREM